MSFDYRLLICTDKNMQFDENFQVEGGDFEGRRLFLCELFVGSTYQKFNRARDTDDPRTAHSMPPDQD